MFRNQQGLPELSTEALSPSKNMDSKKISPKSVMLSSSEEALTALATKKTESPPSGKDRFDEEPFDCAIHTKRDFLRSENLQRNHHSKKNPSSIPMQSPRRLVVPPKSPKSPSSSSKQKASSFRLRRMQLAQQRKWKEEYIERTVQSKSADRDTDDERTVGSYSCKSVRRNIDLGKEVLINHDDGLEISISNQLQKAGFDSSLIPTAERYTFAFNPSNKSNFEYETHDDRSIAMETVSSLNSSHYASDDGLSYKESRSVASRRLRTERKSRRGKVTMVANEDSLHPPLFVSSVKKVRKQELQHMKDAMTNEEEDKPCDEHDQTFNKHTNDVDVIVTDISVMSPFNTSANVNKSANPLDKTAVVSNKLKPPSTDFISDEKENDIPWFKPKPSQKSIESMKAPMVQVSRERPIEPQFLNHSDKTNSPTDEPPSLCNAKSPTTLRRRRLQLYLHPDNDDHTFVDEASQCTKSKQRNPSVKNDLNLQTCTNNALYSSENIDTTRDSTNTSSENINNDDSVSVKSSRSTQTYATLRTCLTVQPASPEEFERVLKQKQRMTFLLHHALTCTYPHATNPDDESYVPCPKVAHCQALQAHVRHVINCTSNKCPVPSCKEYKKVWNHYRRCVLRTFTCPDAKKDRICAGLWEKTA